LKVTDYLTCKNLGDRQGLEVTIRVSSSCRLPY
jgi:hypothetical protein